MSITVTVLFFARAKDLAGAERAEVQLPAATTVGALRSQLAIQYPALGRLLERSAVAINAEYADDSAVIPPDAEVALIPPVSGG